MILDRRSISAGFCSLPHSMMAAAKDFGKVQEAFLKQMHRCFPECGAVATMLKNVRKERVERQALWKKEITDTFGGTLRQPEALRSVPHLRKLKLDVKFYLLTPKARKSFWWFIDKMTELTEKKEEKCVHFECVYAGGQLTATLHYGDASVKTRRLRLR